MTEEMTRYYARRAAEYERVYDIPAWQPALAELQRRVPAFAAGRRVFEVACGTGYWTAHLATTAIAVHATDINDETLALARARAYPRCNVTFAVRDAYAPADGARRWDAGFAGLWLSHVDATRMGKFVDAFHSHLSRGAPVMAFDERDDATRTARLVRVDAATGNRYEGPAPRQW
jgi:demethylmenaquinone methyltransferase/2-methoxy-6-polyprenyl-1,4-benzoquinol methylase